ncbi:uncharacterized protein P884DRAFT_260949 [Thermothelomyces heterothallicus CBS 202.75]|uniref:uncharacterized protein n=1 Tax=Thermothelomyces heterothallicus CBS 202.75 TaxID=1149848 RepID=UPI003742DD66
MVDPGKTSVFLVSRYAALSYAWGTSDTVALAVIKGSDCKSPKPDRAAGSVEM